MAEENQRVSDCIDDLRFDERTATREAQLLLTQGCWGFPIRFLDPCIKYQALGYSKLGYDLFLFLFRIHYDSTGSLYTL